MAASYAVRLGPDGVEGSRCTRCDYPTAPATPRCPVCGGGTRTARFAPRGRVWSATAVHLTVGPFGPGTLTYVDLDDGPRVLVRGATEPAPVGTRVRLVPTVQSTPNSAVDGAVNGIEVQPCA